MKKLCLASVFEEQNRLVQEILEKEATFDKLKTNKKKINCRI